MSILGELAHARGRRDEEPNVVLAQALAASGDAAGVAELAKAVEHGPRPLQNDAIKALYELGALRPELIRPHIDTFLAALHSWNNRLAWGAMTALAMLAPAYPALIAAHLDAILAAAARGSVIAKDRAVSILAALASQPEPVPAAWAALLDMVEGAAVNQTPMYAEAALRAAPLNDPPALAAVVRARHDAIRQPAKRARLDKVLRALARL